MNHPRETRRSEKWVLAAIGGSLVLHGLMMLVPFSPRPMPAEASRSIQLVSPPPVGRPEPEPSPEQEPEPEQQPPVESLTAAPRPAAMPVIAVPTPSPQDPAEEPPASEPSAEPFSERVLASVRQMHGDIPRPEERNVLQARPVPTLPAQPGWLNDFVGTVEPSIDRWENPDGSRQVRIVRRNGQVICGQTRAPSAAEMFNPQFSQNIMTFRICGRERPEPIDRTDPWVRGGPEVTGD